jgi:hypothetical protein
VETNVLDLHWDVLIVLDSCRVDALRAIADEYPFLDAIDELWSVGGHSGEWMAHMFDRKYEETLSTTAYLSADLHTKSVFEDDIDTEDKHIERLSRFGSWDVIPPGEFGRIEHIWRHEVTNDRGPDSQTGGYTLPRHVTDRGIAVSRNNNFDDVIFTLHATPSSVCGWGRRGSPGTLSLRKNPGNTYEKPVIEKPYWKRTSTNYGSSLDDVETLLNNLDADAVAITADHGEAFGEYAVYEHHAASLHPSIR